MVEERRDGIGPAGLDDRGTLPHDEVGQMEEADEGLVGELIDVADLDLEGILALRSGPLAGCIRRLIEQSSEESSVAGFESVIVGVESGPGGESTHVA